MKKLTLFLFTVLSIVISFGQKHELKGNKLHKLEKFKPAIRQFNKAIKVNPNSSSLYFNRARCYRKIGKYGNAIADITKCISLDTNNKEGYKERGAIKAINGQIRAGIIDFTKAIQIDSLYASAYNGRGAAYHLLGEYENSIRDNKKAIALDSSFDASYYNIGLSLNELGRYKEAISYFNNAIRIRYSDHQSFFERGRSLFEVGEYNLAEIDFGNAVIYNDKLDPWEKIDNGRSLYHKGLANIKLNNQNQACIDFELAINFDYYEAKSERAKLNCDIDKQKTMLSTKNEAIIDTVLITISPNPVETYTHIKIIHNASNVNYNLEVLDISGKNIMTIDQISKSYVFDRTNISNGTYLFVIKSNGIILKTEKIIIK
jgi:tetratricopeptide (TPR) repeat protein